MSVWKNDYILHIGISAKTTWHDIKNKIIYDCRVSRHVLVTCDILIIKINMSNIFLSDTTCYIDPNF